MSETKDNHPLYAAVNAKLGEIATAAATPPSWYDAWARLESQFTKEDRLAVYRAVRGAGSLPAEAGFFLFAWICDLLTDDRAAEALREVEEHLDATLEKYGLDEDTAAADEDLPAEYREAMQRCHDAWDALYAATLEEFGEHNLARLFREQPEEFQQQYEGGRQFFHGPDEDDDSAEDAWLDSLRDAVADCIEPDSPMGPLGLFYREEEGFWEVSVYASPVELVGGAQDGEIVVPGFHLDLEQLRQAFDSVTASGWNVLGLHSAEGPYVYVEGVFQEREVYLQVLAYAPEGEEPGLKVDATPRRRRPDEPGR